jgi:hypothetical protein
MSGTCTHIDVTVANLGTTSTAADLNGLDVVGIIFPTGTEGTSCTFEMAMAGARQTDPVTADWFPVKSTAGSAFTVTYAAGDWIVVDPDALSGCRYLRLVVSAQTGIATIRLVTRRRV